MICGYHEYVSIGANLVIKEDLSCEWEIGNTHKTHAVAVHKTIDGGINTAILTSLPQCLRKTKLKHTSHCCARLMLQNRVFLKLAKNLVNW